MGISVYTRRGLLITINVYIKGEGTRFVPFWCILTKWMIHMENFPYSNCKNCLFFTLDLLQSSTLKTVINLHINGMTIYYLTDSS